MGVHGLPDLLLEQPVTCYPLSPLVLLIKSGRGGANTRHYYHWLNRGCRKKNKSGGYLRQLPKFSVSFPVFLHTHMRRSIVFCNSGFEAVQHRVFFFCTPSPYLPNRLQPSTWRKGIVGPCCTSSLKDSHRKGTYEGVNVIECK